MAETFVHLKGLASNNFFMVNVLTFALYLISFTCLVDWTSGMKYDRQDKCTTDTNTTEGCRAFFRDRDKWIQWFLKYGANVTDVETSSEFVTVGDTWKVPLWWLLFILTAIYLTIFTTREFLQLKRAPRKYFRSKENILEVLTLLCTWIYLALVWTPYGYEIEQVFAVIAMFCAWIEMSLMIGRFPSIGIFSFMMFQVINQLIKFLTVYITTLIAFAHAFHLLLIRDDNFDEKEGEYIGVFDSIWTSILKVGNFLSN